MARSRRGACGAGLERRHPGASASAISRRRRRQDADGRWRWRNCCAISARRRSCSAAAMADRLAARMGRSAADMPRDVGDEPLMLARAVPTSCRADRVAGRGAREGRRDRDRDGRRLPEPFARQGFPLIVIDGRRGLGNGRVFPAVFRTTSAGRLPAAMPSSRWSKIAGATAMAASRADLPVSAGQRAAVSANP